MTLEDGRAVDAAVVVNAAGPHSAVVPSSHDSLPAARIDSTKCTPRSQAFSRFATSSAWSRACQPCSPPFIDTRIREKS